MSHVRLRYINFISVHLCMFSGKIIARSSQPPLIDEKEDLFTEQT